MLQLSVAAGPPPGGDPLSVAFVSTCPPRQCGIATFTTDLIRAVEDVAPRVRTVRAAIDEPDTDHRYEPDVRWRVRQGDPESYAAAAHAINRSGVDLVSLQHEFGLYGLWGDTFDDHLPPFLDALRVPLVTTLHTVLPDPSPSVREAVRRIGRRSDAVVVMAETARRILVRTYGLDDRQIEVIPHGVPPVVPRGRTYMKARFGLEGRAVLSTFGLVDPRKGLEYMIRAMSAVVEHHPQALYLIVGRTHPELIRREGERYREELRALIRGRGLERHVSFVDKYLTQQEIIDYLIASDVYVTPYLDPNQITSGTLSYALGAGKAIISTPYLHAVESLAGGRGILAGFRDADELAAFSLRILGDPALKESLERNAYASGRMMAWPVVGARVLGLYREVARAARPAAVV